MIEKKLMKGPSNKVKMRGMERKKKSNETKKAYKNETYGGSIQRAPYKMTKSSTKMRDEMIKAQKKALTKKRK